MLSIALAALLATTSAAPGETAVSLPTETSPLHGTLRTPEGETRAVAVVIPGSGPTNRDGDQPPGIRAGYLRQLAEALADDGIASLRIDKRGVAASTFAGLSEADLRFGHYVADARAWAADAAQRTGQPCAWLIGHSEGALVALAAASEGDTTICGLVLLSGAGRPAGTVIREQFQAALPEPLLSQALAAIAELEAGREVANTPAELAAMFRPSVQPYLISWLALDPAELIAAYEGPVMIGQGTTDIQVSVADAERMAEAQPRAHLVIWNGVNHVLKIAPEDRAGNIATYAGPDLPLAPGVADAVAGFILGETE
jgi:pimeloyl-ACP methyl ester carboxylesterase